MQHSSAIQQYVAKLERRVHLPVEDREALFRLRGYHREHAANETVVADAVPAQHCILIESGLVSRAKTLGDGARQIVAFHLPGDAVDLQSILFSHTDHKIQAHVPTRTFWIAHDDILALSAEREIVSRSLWLDTLVDASIFREWTANVGQRNARQRIAHLFLEMAARFEAIGLLRNDTFELPVTQSALAEALGLSLVHMNKSLQSLKKDGFLTIRDRSVTLTRRDDLTTFSGFDPSYLHLDSARVKETRVLAQSELTEA